MVGDGHFQKGIIESRIHAHNATHAYLPSASSGLVTTFVRILVYKLSDPCLDIGPLLHIIIVRDDIGVFDGDVGHRRVLEILAQTSNGDAVAPVDGHLGKYSSKYSHGTFCLITRLYNTTHILDIDIVRSGLDGNGIVSAVSGVNLLVFFPSSFQRGCDKLTLGTQNW